MEVGANWVLKRMLRSKHGCGKPNVTCYLFEPQPRFLNDSTRKAAELDRTYYVPYAAWIKNTSNMTLHVHTDVFGVGSSIYPESVWMDQARAEKRAATISVPALDLAEWMATHVPPDVYLTMHLDVEGAEYVLLRHLIFRNQICRFYKIDLEGHALYNEQHVAFRAFEVILPWLLHGCERPPMVRLLRYYGTPMSLGKEFRISRWASKKGATDWCPDCKLLDVQVPPSAGLPPSD